MKCLLRVHFWPGIFFIEGSGAGAPAPQQGNQRRSLMSQYPTTTTAQYPILTANLAFHVPYARQYSPHYNRPPQEKDTKFFFLHHF